MSRWLVTHGESQFSAKDLAELKQMASDGRVQPADLIQPPGASDWLYALELPELKDTFPTSITDEDDDSLYGKKKMLPRPVVAAVLMGVTGAGIAAMLHFKSVMDQSLDHGVDSDEAMLSDDVDMHAEPDEDSKVIGTLDKGDVVEFVLRQSNINPKIGDWWLVEANGKEGWIPANAAPSSFGFDESARVDDMALYYPEHHVRLTSPVENGYSWVKLQDKLYGNDADGYVRIKDIAITNESNYALTDVIISIDVLDSKGKVDKRALIELEEPIPANAASLPIGAMYPEFDIDEPDWDLPDEDDEEREAEYKKLTKVIREARHRKDLLNAETDGCLPLQRIFNVKELMEKIDFTPSEEIVRLESKDLEESDKLDKGGKVWKNCLDVELDMGKKEDPEVEIRIYQVRADPDSKKDD